MHRTHQVAARSALTLALHALREMSPESMTVSEIVRLLDLATRLERDTLSSSVEQLQAAAGLLMLDDDDPWQRIADELTGT
jgi:hypothetical protein